MEQDLFEMQIAEYYHHVHIYFVGYTHLCFEIQCRVHVVDHFFYDDHKESFDKKEYKEHSHNFLRKTLNRNVENVCAALQNPDSDLYSDSVNLYKAGPYIFRFSLQNDNVLYINPHHVSHIFIEELK